MSQSLLVLGCGMSALPPDVRRGYAPGMAYGPKTMGQSPNQGRSPKVDCIDDGGAEPRLTSGGGAAAIKPMNTCRTSGGGAAAIKPMNTCRTSGGGAAAIKPLNTCLASGGGAEANF